MPILNTLPYRARRLYYAVTQGVASLALGYVLHWAFSPPLLNPKLELSKDSVRRAQCK